MVRRNFMSAVALSLCFVGVSRAADTVKNADEAIEVFKNVGGVAQYFNTAYGYAVFPKIGKGGLGVGAARGKGEVHRGAEITGVATLSEVSWGLQAGGQAYRQIVFFEDEGAYSDFTSGNFEFDAGAGAIAVTASGDASAGTTGGGTSGSSGGQSGNATATQQYHKGLAVFTIGMGGLMYEVTIAGQKYKFQAAN